jgi:hypothetical protein
MTCIFDEILFHDGPEIHYLFSDQRLHRRIVTANDLTLASFDYDTFGNRTTLTNPYNIIELFGHTDAAR